jgi:hypothetical protein
VWQDSRNGNADIYFSKLPQGHMTAPHDVRELHPPRSLTDLEREVLLAMARNLGAQEGVARCQIEHALVRAECAVPCPTILLHVTPHACAMLDVPVSVPVEATAPDDDGMTIALLLHVARGYIDELEVFRADGESVVSLPAVENLNIV